MNHTSVPYGNAIIIQGGENIVGNQVVEILITDPTSSVPSIQSADAKVTGIGPKAIHSHSTCRVGNKFYSYGGIVDGERSQKLYVLSVIDDCKSASRTYNSL